VTSNRFIGAGVWRVDCKDLLSPLQIGGAHGYLTIKAARPEQRRIENVRPVRRGDHHDSVGRREPVHLDEQLVEGLLSFLVAERATAAAAPYGVELIDENDAGGMTPGVLEQLTDALGAHTGVDLDEFRSAGEQERHLGFARDGTREKRFAGARLSDEKHALGNAATDLGEALRLAQELDNFPHFLLGFVHTGDV